MYVRDKAGRPGIHVKVLAQIAVVIPVSLQRLLQVLHIFRPVLPAILVILARPTPPNSAPPEETPYSNNPFRSDISSHFRHHRK